MKNRADKCTAQPQDKYIEFDDSPVNPWVYFLLIAMAGVFGAITIALILKFSNSM